MDDIVGRQEISQRLGVELHTVDVWRQRGIFPEPDLTVSGRPLWAWPTIEVWARETKRISAPSPWADWTVDTSEAAAAELTPSPESALERELRLSRENDR